MCSPTLGLRSSGDDSVFIVSYLGVGSFTKLGLQSHAAGDTYLVLLQSRQNIYGRETEDSSKLDVVANTYSLYIGG